MSSAKNLTPLAQHFLQPTNATHRQYEALRAYFVEGLPGPERSLHDSAIPTPVFG